MKQRLVYLLFTGIFFNLQSADTPNPQHYHQSTVTAVTFPLRACRALCYATNVSDATVLLKEGALNCMCDVHQKKYCTQRLMRIIMAQKYSPDLIPLYLDRGLSATDIDCFKGTPLKYLIVSAYEYQEHLNELKAKLDFIFSRLNSQEIMEYTHNDQSIDKDTLCYHKGIRYLESMLKADLHKEEYCLPYVLLSEGIVLHRTKAFKTVLLAEITQQQLLNNQT